MNVRSLLPFLVLGAAAAPAAAQIDSSPPQRAWISVGIGPSTMILSGIASGSYSRGQAVVTARVAGAGGIFGPRVADRSLLLGVRTPGSSRFVLTSIGIGRARYSYQCDCSGGDRGDPAKTVAVFELKGLAGAEIAELGLSVFGAIGPDRTHYIGTALSVNFGWFGADDGVLPKLE